MFGPSSPKPSGGCIYAAKPANVVGLMAKHMLYFENNWISDPCLLGIFHLFWWVILALYWAFYWEWAKMRAESSIYQGPTPLSYPSRWVLHADDGATNS